MEKKKVVIVGSVVLGTIALGFLIYKIINRRKTKEASEEFKPDVETKVLTTNDSFPLKKGSKGNNVVKLQSYLNTKIKAPMGLLKTDGIFGSGTESVLKTITGKTVITEAEFNNLSKTTQSTVTGNKKPVTANPWDYPYKTT
jgi:hypothetical protein